MPISSWRRWLGPALLTTAWNLAGAQAPTPTFVAPAAAQYHTVQAADRAGLSSHEARVEAVRDALLAAQVPGAIVALQVQAGDRVQKGQTLLRIDARMASQGASASRAQVAAAQAQLAVARKEYERQQQLFAKRYISQAALDSAQAQWQAAQAQVQALQAQAGVAATQAHLHTVQAPFAGVVARVPVTLGDMAMPGTPLLALYDPGALRVTAHVSSAQAAALRQAASVEVELVDSPGSPRLTVTAAHIQVLPTADAHAHTVPVRVALPADLPDVVPGMFARLWLPDVRDAGATDAAGMAPRLWIPARAVVRRAEMTGVYVQGANGQPLLRQVRLGVQRGEQVEVLSGVRVGEQVALEPDKAIRER